MIQFSIVTDSHYDKNNFKTTKPDFFTRHIKRLCPLIICNHIVIAAC